MLNPDRWRQIEAAYEASVDLALADRGPALERICGDDHELRAQVETLLTSDGASTHLHEVVGREASGLVESVPPMLGRRIGPYRLVGELGRGGMGAVYRSERDDEYRTEVAIKLLHRGLETQHAIARFRDERQILATLEHPGIVRLLDGGTTEDGLPYLVMEYVRGVPITHYVRDRVPTVPERIELFRAVCAAVQFAHQHLVVHRDLKPSNILVTDEGIPKLLDFGIAKLLDDSSHEARTRTGMQLLTPEYASPEQARGEPVSVATDIYSLGAMLYELLTDRPAHQLGGASGLGLLKVILETVPPRPSTIAPADRRRAIAGDLDNIVLKALAKESHHRYATVEQLSDDLARHLDGLPVAARAGTWRYRAGKFIRRNRVLVAASLIVALALGAATAISVGQARRANEAAAEASEQADRAKRRFDDVRKLANTLLFEVDDGIKNLEGTTAVRERIVSRALGYLDGLAKEARDDPALSRELAMAYMKIGDIQGDGLGPNLGRPADGLGSYHKAKDLVARLDPHDLTTRGMQARVHSGIGKLSYNVADLSQATASLLEASRVIDSLPLDADYDHHLAVTTTVGLFQVAAARDDAIAIRKHTQRLVDGTERWMRLAPSADARYWTGIVEEVKAEALGAAADPDAAVASMQHAIEMFRALSTEFPSRVAYRRELGSVLHKHAGLEFGSGNSNAWMPGLGDRVAAETSFRDGLAVLERLMDDKNDVRAVTDVAIALTSLAAVVFDRDVAEATRLFKRARALYADLLRSARELGYAEQNEWFLHCAMARALVASGDKAEAVVAIREGTTRASASKEDMLRVPTCNYLVADAWRMLGDVRTAERLLEQAATELRHLVAIHPTNGIYRVGLVATLDRLASLQREDRCRLGREALAVWEKWPGSSTAYTKRQVTARHAAIFECKSRPDR